MKRVTLAAAAAFSTVVPTTTQALTTTPTNVHTVPDTIAADCSVEVSAAINEWINSVPDGSTLQFAQHGCYLVEGTLQVVDRLGLKIDGRGSEFRSETNGESAPPNAFFNSSFGWPRVRAHWMFYRGGGHEIRDIHVNGPNTSCRYHGGRWEEQHPVGAYGVNGLLIEDITGREVNGDSVTISPARTADGSFWIPAANVTVRNSEFDCLGRQGLSITWASDVLIENNTFDRIGRSAFDIEPVGNNWEIHRVTYRNNTIGRFGGIFFANAGAANAPHSDIEVSNNRLTTEPITVVSRSTSGRSNYRFVGNVGAGVVTGGVAAIRFLNVDGVDVADNQQTIFGRYGRTDPDPVNAGVAVGAEGSTDIAVRDNVFPRDIGVVHPSWAGPLTVLTADPGTVTLQCGNFTPEAGEPLGEPVDGACS